MMPDWEGDEYPIWGKKKHHKPLFPNHSKIMEEFGRVFSYGWPKLG